MSLQAIHQQSRRIQQRTHAQYAFTRTLLEDRQYASMMQSQSQKRTRARENEGKHLHLRYRKYVPPHQSPPLSYVAEATDDPPSPPLPLLLLLPLLPHALLLLERAYRASRVRRRSSNLSALAAGDYFRSWNGCFFCYLVLKNFRYPRQRPRW